MSHFCQECGAERDLVDDVPARFCGTCGQAFEKEPQPTDWSQQIYVHSSDEEYSTDEYYDDDEAQLAEEEGAVNSQEKQTAEPECENRDISESIASVASETEYGKPIVQVRGFEPIDQRDTNVQSEKHEVETQTVEETPSWVQEAEARKKRANQLWKTKDAKADIAESANMKTTSPRSPNSISSSESPRSSLPKYVSPKPSFGRGPGSLDDPRLNQRYSSIEEIPGSTLQVQEIQKKFIGDVKIVAEGRVLIREGGLIKLSRRGPRKYLFHLFSDILIYSDVTAIGYSLHRQINLDTMHVKDLDEVDTQENMQNKLKYAFQILSGQKSFIVCANNQDDKEMWLHDLFKCLAPYMQTSKRTVSKTAAPVWTPDKMSRECMHCHNGFTMLNRRHHCRKCGSLVCSACSPHKQVLRNINRNKPVRICIKCH